MGSNDLQSRIADFVDDRVGQGVFRVKKDIYTDADIHEHEVKALFERDWVFLCHESQIKAPGDYFTTHIGRQPVFVLRQDDGSLRAFRQTGTAR